MVHGHVLQKPAALIVVDFQNDFTPPHGSLAVEGGREILPVINDLLRLPFVQRITTQDWHPPDHISFAQNHPAPNNIPFTSKILITNPNDESDTVEMLLWPAHCVQESQGAELIDGLDESRITDRVKKGKVQDIEMYSAFRAPFRKSVVSDSGLHGMLEMASIKQVFVVGLAYDFCVKATALHAAELGFETFVVEDATRAVHNSPSELEDTRRGLRAGGVRIIDSKAQELSSISA